jgi:CheY-like chemotaxis protein
MKKTILLVDDESTIRWILRVMLEGHNFSVLEASSGEEGIAVAKQVKPNLIIMDYKMPDMSGWAATASIKQLYPDVIIIGHTGYANDQIVQEGLKAGCAHILHKPVDLDEWERTIAEYAG